MDRMPPRQSLITYRDSDIDGIYRTQGHIINHVRQIDYRVSRLEACKRKRKPQSNISVSMIIDWRMIAAIVILIMGMLGLLQVEHLKDIASLNLTLK